MPQSDNKRIAKNTIYLYLRMIIVMGVTLYTSRVVLKTLGVADYGIYNIVGGVVILFSFMRNSLTTALQRYLNYALGKNDTVYEKKLFSTGFYILLIFAGIILLILETVGLWFVNTQLSLPAGSLSTTNIVYQLSVIAFLVNIIRTPYDSLIMAHQRMSFYAIISIVEAALKLAIVYLLVIIPSNKLILYSILILAVMAITNVIYIVYSKRNFNLAATGYYSKEIAKDLSSFSGWNIFGGIADIGYQQGTNIILNIFYGVTLNATMGIANQVKSAVFSFVRNILSAANPQIFQLHAAGHIQEFQILVYRISKFAYFLFLIIALPLIFNIDYILHLWLEDVPPMCGYFCTLILIFCMIDSLIGPLWTATQAEGNIKVYQIISSAILLLNLPFTYIAFRLGFPPYSMLFVQIIVVIISLLYRIIYLCLKGLLNSRAYFRMVIWPTFSLTIFSICTSIAICHFLPNYDFWRFIISLPTIIITCISFVFMFGLTNLEKTSCLNLIKNVIHK